MALDPLTSVSATSAMKPSYTFFQETVSRQVGPSVMWQPTAAAATMSAGVGQVARDCFLTGGGQCTNFFL